VWFLVLSLLPLFLSNTIGYQVTRRIIERQAQRYLIALATAEAGHVAAEIERHQQNLDAEVEGNTALAGMLVLLADSERRAADAADLDRLRVHLERKLEELPAFSELIALNNGRGRIGRRRTCSRRAGSVGISLKTSSRTGDCSRRCSGWRPRCGPRPAPRSGSS
jgi:hypothetical protein